MIWGSYEGARNTDPNKKQILLIEFDMATQDFETHYDYYQFLSCLRNYKYITSKS